MANMKLIEAKTLASNAATVVFTAIPQTYTDLVLVVSTRTDGAYTADSLYVTMNSSTSNFSWENLYGRGTGTVISQNNTNNELANAINGASSTSTTFSNVEIYIPNYRNTAHNKSISTIGSVENNAAVGDNYVQTVLWNDTSSITSMTLAPIPGSAFVTHSTFYLYGVDAANIGAKATGGNITYDSTYFYHTFLASGTFTPTTSLTADYLVVAGGGGSGYGRDDSPPGSYSSGGGGAGGLRSTVTATGGGGALESPLSLSTNTTYTVTVGAGGAGASTLDTQGSDGSNSVFSTITSTGGGGGGAVSNDSSSRLAGRSGGSGGGGANSALGSGGGGSASPSDQGYAGGNGASGAPSYASGGGGGAGGVGANATTSVAGNGGVALAVSISGSSVYYAGGGGGNGWAGGAGGLGGGTATAGQKGGGGDGGYHPTATNGTAGTANTGGGAGGSYDTRGGVAGGSGIVIVRYAK